MTKLTSESFIKDLSPEEIERAKLVESILPTLRERASETDRNGEFDPRNLELFSSTGLTGLVIPKEYGGLGGTLRDLTAATFSIGTACPSTALAFFFHCSASSRGLLPLEALNAGLFSEQERDLVKNFAEKVLFKMGRENKWFGNFASETSKSEKAMITINTTAEKTEGGYLLKGVKSFGCSTGVADHYLVTAQLDGIQDSSGLATFLVDPQAKGISERTKWDAIGMRGTATHGIILDKVFVAEENALAIPQGFTKMMQMAKGSSVGNQLAGTAVYLGAAHEVYHTTLDTLMSRKFQDTGKSIANSPMHQELIGKMTEHLTTAKLWLRRQLDLETASEEGFNKDATIINWRICKGVVAESAFQVAVNALKCAGTSGTTNSGAQARSLRDLSMGLVQAFPAEKGRLEAAKMIVTKKASTLFGR